MLEQAFEALLGGSTAVSGNMRKAASRNSHVMAFNTIPDYPRREVVAINLGEQPRLKAMSAQISPDKSTGYMLVDAAAGKAIGNACGSFADVEPVKSEFECTWRSRRGESEDCVSIAQFWSPASVSLRCPTALSS